MVIGPLEFSLECGKRNTSRDPRRRVSNTVMRLFSPLRKKSRRLYRQNRPSQQRTRIFRPSTVSLPAQMVRIAVDPGTRAEHWFSMVQLAAEATSPPPIVPSPAVSLPKDSEESQKITKEAEIALGMAEMGENVSVVPEGVSTTVETLPQSTPPSVAETNEVQIGRLKREEQRLEAAIRNIESRQTGAFETFSFFFYSLRVCFKVLQLCCIDLNWTCSSTKLRFHICHFRSKS